jgi:outer membrane lipoprotein
MTYDGEDLKRWDPAMIRPSAVILLFFLASLAGCAVMPPEVMRDAITGVPFSSLIRNAAGYHGETVIVGGYVIEVANEADQSRIVALQTEMNGNQKPGSRDLSRGRIVIDAPGFIDPEVYQKDRKITVAGKIIGSSQTAPDKFPFPYLHIEMTRIHLWPEETVVPYDPYRDDPGPVFYPRLWFWRYPYRW